MMLFESRLEPAALTYQLALDAPITNGIVRSLLGLPCFRKPLAPLTRNAATQLHPMR